MWATNQSCCIWNASGAHFLEQETEHLIYILWLQQLLLHNQAVFLQRFKIKSTRLESGDFNWLQCLRKRLLSFFFKIQLFQHQFVPFLFTAQIRSSDSFHVTLLIDFRRNQQLPPRAVTKWEDTRAVFNCMIIIKVLHPFIYIYAILQLNYRCFISTLAAASASRFPHPPHPVQTSTHPAWLTASMTLICSKDGKEMAPRTV